MMNELVSIVTPCYNGEQYIERFFDSILQQTYPAIELVFVNDSSTDKTKEIVNDYRSKFDKRGIGFVYCYQKNAGQAAALNSGLKLFSGQYLLWVDSDDTLSKNFIESRVKYLKKYPGSAFCYGKAVFVDEREPETIVFETEKREDKGRYTFFEDVCINVKDVFFSGYMCRVEDLDKVIKNRDIYTGEGGQNAQLLLPLSWYYGEPGYVEESIYKYYLRENSHSHSQNTSRKIIAQIERYEKILIESIKRIPDERAQKYIPIIKNNYARQKFCNAVDTKCTKLIWHYFKELRRLRIIRFHDILMIIKYTILFQKE